MYEISVIYLGEREGVESRELFTARGEAATLAQHGIPAVAGIFAAAAGEVVTAPVAAPTPRTARARTSRKGAAGPVSTADDPTAIAERGEAEAIENGPVDPPDTTPPPASPEAPPAPEPQSSTPPADWNPFAGKA